jgi:hypothetical protein
MFRAKRQNRLVFFFLVIESKVNKKSIFLLNPFFSQHLKYLLNLIQSISFNYFTSVIFFSFLKLVKLVIYFLFII